MLYCYIEFIGGGGVLRGFRFPSSLLHPFFFFFFFFFFFYNSLLSKPTKVLAPPHLPSTDKGAAGLETNSSNIFFCQEQYIINDCIRSRIEDAGVAAFGGGGLYSLLETHSKQKGLFVDTLWIRT